MNKLLTLTIACVCVVSCSSVALAAFSAAPGYTSTELYSSAEFYTAIGGLDLDGGKLYFGQFTDIMSLDLSNNSTDVVGTVPSNAGNSLVIRHDGGTWTSYGTSYNKPYPCKMGYFDAGGVYQNQLDEDGIYDVAVNSSGDCYIVANPDGDDVDEDPDGSKIFKYDWGTGNTTEIANIGGYSGGLAFDSADNLYYAEQTNGEILKFTADEVSTGGLDTSDADVVLNLTAAYIGFNATNEFFASTYGTLSEYSFTTGTKVEDIALADGYDSIGQFVIDGNNFYLIDSDWGAYASTIQEVTAVPEPSLFVLLIGMALAAVALRR